MDVREKLVELLFKCAPQNTKAEWRGAKIEVCISQGKIADYLVAHGVTVQEWISVEDRLPEEECRCLVIDAAGDIEMDCYDGKGRFVLDRSGAVQHPSHWMPLPKMPQPPKGD